jgi:transposase
MEHTMPKPNDLSRSLVALEQDSTLIAVIEMSLLSWLVAGIAPGIERQPLKKLEADERALLGLLERWRDEAARGGRAISRIAVAFEAGRDGFWLARWLGERGIEAHVIHPTSIPVSREHRRAKTDRLDTNLLKRAFLGWLRGEPGHCSMAAIPTLVEEDAKRPNREREHLVGERTRIVNRMKSTLARLGIRGFKPTLRRAPARLATLVTPEGVPLPANTRAELEREMTRLRLVREQIAAIEAAREARLDEAPAEGPHAMMRLLARVLGIGIETADMLVQGAVAPAARPPGGGALRRPHRRPRRERQQAAREGARPGRQRPRPPRHDPARLALPALPQGERPGAVVPRAHRRRGGQPQDDDRRPCPQAARRLVAHDDHRRDPPGCRAAAGGVSGQAARPRQPMMILPRASTRASAWR